MKYLFSLLVFALYLSSVAPARAEQVTTPEKNDTFLAHVSLTRPVVSQSERVLTITFTLKNERGVQPRVKYGVLLIRETDTDAYIEDEYVSDEVLTLFEGVSIDLTMVYPVPTSLGGTYNVYIVSKSELGIPLGFAKAGSVVVPNATAPLTMESKGCYLTVSGRSGGKKYGPMENPVLTAGESLVSHCMVKNTSESEKTITPQYVTAVGSVLGANVPSEGGSLESIAVPPNTSTEVVTTLPKATQPGTYAVTVTYDTDGSAQSYTYTVGTSPTIDNIVLSNSHYNAGDVAALTLVVGGTKNLTGTYTYLAELLDRRGNLCGESQSGALTKGMSPLLSLTVPVTGRCDEPAVRVNIIDETGKTVLTRESKVELPEAPVDVMTPPDMLPTKSGPTSFPLSMWLSIIGLLIGLGFLSYTLYKKLEKKEPTPPIALLFLILVCWFVAPPEAHAIGFTQNDGACYVNTNVYARSGQPFPRTGEPIDVFVSSPCPGIMVTGVYLNTGVVVYSGTTNGLGYFNTSFPAPSADDSIIYVTGDWTRGPFGTAIQPWELIYVNRCIPATINYCTTPGGEYFGAAVGATGGTCTTSGSCSYTCQADLTWRQNSNSCSAPPPPPPGSTPEFTNTPSCTIAGNASSCVALLNIVVPAAYSWGADLKLCDGTFLKTLGPGNWTESVTVPYNTQCFALHPWSFIPQPSTDMVNVPAPCAPNTTWNNSVCVPNPPSVPSAPTGLSAQTGASCGTRTISVSWNSVSGATSYDLLRDGTTLISGVTSAYPDVVLVAGSSHTYQVRAWVSGVASAWSTPAVSGTASADCSTPTGTLTVGTCTVPEGQSSCQLTVSWTTANTVSPNARQNGSIFSTAPQNTTGTTRTVSYGTNTFTLNDGVTQLDTESITITCASGTAWNNTICESTSVPPPPSLPCPGGNEFNGCIVGNTAAGASSGSCKSSTHTGTCSIQCDPGGSGSWILPGNNNCVLTPPPPVTGSPTLTTISRVVRIGTTIPIQWDTNNSNENICTLTGGSLPGGNIPLNTTDPSAEEGSVNQTITGRTTYTLTCPSGNAVLTIEVIPADGET